MTGRDPGEGHRAATPLELLYDLCFVGAIAQAAHALLHALEHGDSVAAITSYSMVIFAIWWAWMGCTWFASAFDTDDPVYRVKVFLQMCGVLLIAAGITNAFGGDYRFVVYGYAIIRIVLIAQWLRAARLSATHRATAMRYVIGNTVCQIGWFGLLFAPGGLWKIGFAILAGLELIVPIFAERVGKALWHPEHIAERYGLLTIIVVGESVLSVIVGIQKMIATGSHNALFICYRDQRTGKSFRHVAAGFSMSRLGGT